MPTGSIQVYASVAGQAAPLAGVQVAVLDESGVTVARLTTDEAGAAEVTNLPAPNASYSLQETNTTVSFQSYIANVASSEVYPTWVGHAVYSAPLPRRASRACTAAKSARETSPSWVPGTTIHCDRGNRTLRADL